MNKNASFIILICLLLFGNIDAQIITVDNKHPFAGDYTNLQEAHDAASAGDIIYVSPSMIPYPAIVVTKQLFFYGVGFDITENIGVPFTPTTSISGEMQFNSGSEGSLLEGFDGTFYVTVRTNNVIIKRNDLAYMSIQAQGGVILQNKFIYSRGSSTSTLGLIASFGSSNIIISNNIIFNTSSSSGYAIIGGSDLMLFNNVIRRSIRDVSNSQVINNIILDGGISRSNNNSYRYNLAMVDIFGGQGIGNVIEPDMSTVFVDPDNYDFHLLPNSPAKSAGENGTDMGIYGGDAPYVDGGFPGLPSILQIQAPIVGSKQSGIQVNFKAKSNNE